MTSTTTDVDVDRFRADGYLLPGRQLFSPERLDALEAIFTEHLAAKGAKLSDELDTPHFRDPRLLEFLLSDEVLDTVEPLVGPDIALSRKSSSRGSRKCGVSSSSDSLSPFSARCSVKIASRASSRSGARSWRPGRR